jgi:hypothetical protein
LAQLVLGVITIFLTPVVGWVIGRLVSNDSNNLYAECVATTGDADRSKNWILRLHTKKYFSENVKIKCIPDAVENRIIKADEIRFHGAVNRFNVDGHGCAECCLHFLPQGQWPTFHIELFYPGSIFVMMGQHEVYTSYLKQNSDEEITEFGLEQLNFMLMVKMRMHSLLIACALYASIALARIVYLGITTF